MIGSGHNDEVPPDVTVVMPAYQAERTIGAALSSVLSQTGVDFDVVVVDDGSTDATAAIVRAHGRRVRLVQQENRGVSAARNVGVHESRGGLIAFCDADDIFFDTHLESLVAVWRRTGGGIATANSWLLFPGGIRVGRTFHEGRFPPPRRQRRAILEQCFVSYMSVFPKRLFVDIGAFDESLPAAEDWDFWLRAVLAGATVVHQPKPLALYRWSAAGLTSRAEQMDAAVQQVLTKALVSGVLRDDERSYAEARLAAEAPQATARRADAALRAGRYREAAALYRQAAKFLPGERRLVLKARLIGAAPPVAGRLLRKRQTALDRTLAARTTDAGE